MSYNVSSLLARELLLAQICHVAEVGGDWAISLGFQQVPEAGIQRSSNTLPLKLFVPLFFPIEHTTRSSARAFDWSNAPRSVTLIVVVETHDNFQSDRVWETLNAFRETCEQEEIQLEIVRDTSAYIRASINLLREAFDISSLDLEMTIELTGFGQGGSIAAAATLCLYSWSQDIGTNLRCTTFDAPGIHACYLEFASGDKEMWETRVTNFICDPNPINLINSHYGRIIHIRTKIETPSTWTWNAGCALLDLGRIVSLALFSHASLFDWIAPLFIRVSIGAISKMLKTILPAFFCYSVCVAHIYGYNNGSAMHALMSIMGKTAEEVKDSHSMTDILEALESYPRCPERFVEMQSWPTLERVSFSMMDSIIFLIRLFIPLVTTNRGIRFIKNRQQLVQNRKLLIKGFTPLRNGQFL